MNRLACLLLLLLPLSACGSDAGTPASPPGKAGEIRRPDRVSGEYIVKLREPAAGESVLRKELAAFDIVSIKQVSPGFFLIRFATDPGLKSLQSALADSRVAESVQPNYRYYNQPPAAR